MCEPFATLKNSSSEYQIGGDIWGGWLSICWMWFSMFLAPRLSSTLMFHDVCKHDQRADLGENQSLTPGSDRTNGYKEIAATLPETNSKFGLGPQKEIHLPTIHFQGRTVSFREGIYKPL